MTVIEAIILGIIQGLTEFLPVSSSGHLVLFGNIFGVNGDFVLFSVLMHVATLLAVLVFFSNSDEKGNVIPGLAIAILGVIANSFFWIRYKKIGNETNNNILKTQSKLYRAKTFVDCSVVIALMVVMISTNQQLSYYFDIVGTIYVSIYLAYSGISTFIKTNRRIDKNENQII